MTAERLKEISLSPDEDLLAMPWDSLTEAMIVARATIATLTQRIAELEAALAEARKDGERLKSLRWRPMDQLHEDHFPVLAIPAEDPGGFQMFSTVDEWNDLEEEEAAPFTVFLPLSCTAREGFCPTLDAAIDAAKEKQ